MANDNNEIRLSSNDHRSSNYVTGYTMSCDLKLDPDLIRIMETSRHEPELRYTWMAWRDKIGPPIRNTFMRYIDLANQGAQKHGQFAF